MLRTAIRKMLGLLFWRPLPPPSSAEARALQELRETFAQLPLLVTAGKPSSEAEWMGNLNRLRERVLRDDPRQFLRWDVIAYTMFVFFARYIHRELAFLKSRPDWNARWRPAISESAVGRPIPYLLYPASSANLIHHAYHLAQFEHQGGGPVHEIELVLEFGGGYGSMCRLFHNLGFRGRYLIFDLRPMSALQKFYLQTLGLPVRSLDDFHRQLPGVYCLSELEPLQALLAGAPAGERSMFLATWSLSETPVSLRESVRPLVLGFNAFLIAYQDRFGEVDNLQYFSEWQQTLPLVQWQGWPIPHLGGSRYLMGRPA